MSREPKNPFEAQPAPRSERSRKRTPSSIIASFTGDGNTLPIPRILLEYFSGNYSLAVLTSQLLYWSDRTRSKEGWIYKTYRDMESEIYMSESTVRRAADKLKKIGWLETKRKKANGSPTVHYRIDIDKLGSDLTEFVNSGVFEDGDDAPE